MREVVLCFFYLFLIIALVAKTQSFEHLSRFKPFGFIKFEVGIPSIFRSLGFVFQPLNPFVEKLLFVYFLSYCLVAGNARPGDGGCHGEYAVAP